MTVGGGLARRRWGHLFAAETPARLRLFEVAASYAPGGSNYAFGRYDSAMSGLIGINQQAFRTAIRDDQRHLLLGQLAPATGAPAVLLLLFLGLRPRLAEYR